LLHKERHNSWNLGNIISGCMAVSVKDK